MKYGFYRRLRDFRPYDEEGTASEEEEVVNENDCLKFAECITAGNVYKCGQWYTNEGTVQLLINVRSYQPGHSGTTTYMFQGGFSAIGSTATVRLLPLTSGTGHGNGPDTGENSNAWEVLIDSITNYT